MQAKRLFNPTGDDSLETRRIVGGNSTNIFNLNNVRYQWANRMYRNMMANFWIPEKTDLSSDLEPYKHLTVEERQAYDGILSFLIFLDSIQTNNLSNINDFITAPEVNLLIAIQQYQEAIHSQSYQYTVESIIPADRRNSIYDKWRSDKVLFERNKYIAQIYQDFIDEPSQEHFYRAIIANYLLEGLYFYNGFNFFYNLASRHLMLGTSEIIRYINRDELTHCVLFELIVREIRELEPEFFPAAEVETMFRTAVEQEIGWTSHIIGDGILGISEETTELYTKWLANERWNKLGFSGKLYEGYNKNPYLHLEKLADTEGEGSVKSNFFESTVSAYNQSSVLDGWDDF
ncbi:ribonucleotide-diphosphate reductase subunit beta [Pelovirga terrestris]|uniref:Ribonucleoside-diphosphate reductase subunit beta n=1 Tax=Pelovirga terrestris TaxID=2771352 RepID=A0A8J6QXS7_9BACT|nr:ribonucleotide-diphosphate reductase subunit beta [Pelovirga terrestris]MBD1401031.1 ribonucleotide-diphosphate reductase subunit beta [Pelovirga terrestris]